MNVETIRNQLTKLRLPTAAAELEEILAKDKKAVSLNWVSELFEREIDAKKQKATALRIKQAGFPELTTLENFDWKFNPDIDQNKVKELATLKFVDDNQISLFLGPPGVGKSHVAIAIGVKAAEQGNRVYWTSAKRLSQQITLAKMKNSLDMLFRRLLSCKLWIIDDWGVVSFNREIAEEIFDLLDRRKYSTSMILTSNRDINEWAEVFPDPVIANATIDRIFDSAKIVLFKGKSYRLKGRIKTRELNLEKLTN